MAKRTAERKRRPGARRLGRVEPYQGMSCEEAMLLSVRRLYPQLRIRVPGRRPGR